MVSKYNKILEHLDWFKEQIKNSKEGIIRVKLKDVVSEMLGQEFVEISDDSICSRLKDILLENGIKIKVEHINISRDNLNISKDKVLTMEMASENEIVKSADAMYLRCIKNAEKKGITIKEYQKSCEYEYKRGLGSIEDNKDCGRYFGEYIERKYVFQIFEDPVPFEFPKDELGRITDNRKPYDYLCCKGLKLKHISSCIREDKSHIQKLTGEKLPYFAYAIRRNKIPDQFVLSAWDNRESLKPLFVWIIKGKEMFQTQISNKPFWERDTFTIYFNSKGINKMKKYEVTDKLEKLKEVCRLSKGEK
jgi:hypothetical protein